MLCLSDSIRDNDPSVQRFLSAVEEARTLTALILAAWPFTRGLFIHIVEAVLAERARCPSSWPRCPRCGVPLQGGEHDSCKIPDSRYKRAETR
jgi:hypothetical protein